MKPEHQLFAHHYILSGDKEKAYKTAYPAANGEPLKNAARRLINHPEVRDYINKRMEELQQNAANSYHEEQKRREEAEYATLLLKRKVLRNMIDGKHKQLRYFKFKDHVETIEENLSPFVILRAIELDTKLAAEWYSRGGKIAAPATANAAQQGVRTRDIIVYEEKCELRFGPNFMPALRARTVRDNPHMAREYERMGLKVGDKPLTYELEQLLETEQSQRLDALAEAYAKHRPLDTLPEEDPECLQTAYKQEEILPGENEPAQAPQHHIVATTKNSIPFNKYARPRTAPPGVNPMSVPGPVTRYEYTPEELQKMWNDCYYQSTQNPDSIFYIPPAEETKEAG